MSSLSITVLICNSQPHSPIRCCSDSNSKRRGFGPQQDVNKVSDDGAALRRRKSTSQQSGNTSNQAPWLSFRSNSTRDLQFQERLEAIKRSTLDQKKAEQIAEFGKIEYDAPVELAARSKTGLGTKIGLGVAVVVFGLIFALGDFIPTESSSQDGVNVKMSEEDKANLQARMQQFEETLKISPKDSTALEVR